jgi:mono/diheme cytochrome c family protein
MIRHKLLNISVAAVTLVLACCDGNGANPGAAPRSNVQEDVMAPRVVFSPAPMPRSPEAAPLPSINEGPQAPPRFGIAGIAQVSDVEGNVRRGRDFAFDNCRPCHVVAPNQRSTTRFSTAPDFRSVANMPSTTPLSLIVWLTNPHPTMPSLILSPQEASDVIAYIESLRTAR